MCILPAVGSDHSSSPAWSSEVDPVARLPWVVEAGMAGPVDAMPPLPGYLDNRMPQLMTMPLTLPKRLSTPLSCLPRSLHHLFVGLPVALSGWVFRYGLTHSGMSYWSYPKVLPCHWLHVCGMLWFGAAPWVWCLFTYRSSTTPAWLTSTAVLSDLLGRPSCPPIVDFYYAATCHFCC